MGFGKPPITERMNESVRCGRGGRSPRAAAPHLEHQRRLSAHSQTAPHTEHARRTERDAEHGASRAEVGAEHLLHMIGAEPAWRREHNPYCIRQHCADQLGEDADLRASGVFSDASTSAWQIEAADGHGRICGAECLVVRCPRYVRWLATAALVGLTFVVVRLGLQQ